MTTKYPTVSAWALDKITQHPALIGTHRLILLALAADADRALHDGDGYAGTTMARFRELTLLPYYRTEHRLDELMVLNLVEARTSEPVDPDDAEVFYRVPERLLPYMTD